MFLSRKSRSNCLSECYILEAMSYCNCVPWDYPIPDAISASNEITICDFYGNSCFNSYIQNGMAANCHNRCDTGCNEIKFYITTEKEPIKWQDICDYDPRDTDQELDLFERETFEFLFNTTYSGRSGVVRFQEALLKSEDTKSFAKMYCEKKLKSDIAMVEVVMDSPTFIKYIQTHKATTTDKLANFGKEK